MKLAIRMGMFETNSSSVHSIVIAEGFSGDIDYNRYWSCGGMFGRYDKEVLDDTASKLDYLWQAILDISSDVDSGEGPGSIDRWREIIGQFLPEATLEIEYDSQGFLKGYIDHGGEYWDMLCQMESDTGLVGRYLLNPQSRVFMSSDEDYEKPDYPDCEYVEFTN